MLVAALAVATVLLKTSANSVWRKMGATSPPYGALGENV